MEVSIYTLIRRDRESELQEIFLNLIIYAWSINDMINNHCHCRCQLLALTVLTSQWSTRVMRPSKILPVVIHRLFGTSLESKHAQPSDYTNTHSHIFGQTWIGSRPGTLDHDQRVSQTIIFRLISSFIINTQIPIISLY